MPDVLSSLNERCDSLISKLIMIFEKIKIKGAMKNLIFVIFSKCVNMADINAP